MKTPVDELVDEIVAALSSAIKDVQDRAEAESKIRMKSLVVGAEVGWGFLYMGKCSYGKYQVRNYGFSKIAKIMPSGRFVLENGLTFSQKGSRSIGGDCVWLMPAAELTEMLQKQPIIQRRLGLVEKIRMLVDNDDFPYGVTDDAKALLLKLVNAL